MRPGGPPFDALSWGSAEDDITDVPSGLVCLHMNGHPGMATFREQGYEIIAF